MSKLLMKMSSKKDNNQQQLPPMTTTAAANNSHTACSITMTTLKEYYYQSDDNCICNYSKGDNRMCHVHATTAPPTAAAATDIAAAATAVCLFSTPSNVSTTCTCNWTFYKCYMVDLVPTKCQKFGCTKFALHICASE